MTAGPMSEAEIERAIGEAARILSSARQPVIAGLGTDIAGVVAACRLAEKIGAAIDHDAAESALRQLSVLRDTGTMLVTPAEGLVLADTILIVGEHPFSAPELQGLLSDRSQQRKVRLLCLCAGEAIPESAGEALQSLNAPALGIHGVLAGLCARVNSRPVASGIDREAMDQFAATLHAASYGVAVFAPDELDALALEMLAGLVKDLNATTRWSGLPIPESVTAAGAMMAAGWMTGLPLRSTFIDGAWRHDPWRFEAKRMLEAGEADAAVYICSYEDAPPDWLPDIPAILMINAPRIPPRRNAIRISIGQPGRDHDSVLYDRLSGQLAHRAASAPTNVRSVAAVLDRIAGKVSAP